MVVAALATFALASFMALVSLGGVLIAVELKTDGRYVDATISTVNEEERTIFSTIPQETCTTRVVARFTDARGVTHRATVDYPGCDTGLAVGDVITLLYPPNDPTSAVRAESGARALIGDAVFTGGFAVFFSMATILFIRRAVRSVALRRSRCASEHIGEATSPPIGT